MPVRSKPSRMPVGLSPLKPNVATVKQQPKPARSKAEQARVDSFELELERKTSKGISKQYQAMFNQLKEGGLTAKEQATLIAQASKDISKSDHPDHLAKAYTEEVKGWVPKKLAAPTSTVKKAPQEFANKAQERQGEIIDSFRPGVLQGGEPIYKD